MLLFISVLVNSPVVATLNLHYRYRQVAILSHGV